MIAFGFVSEDKRREARAELSNERALAALSSLVAKDEFERMEREVRCGLREIRIENGFVITCLTPV